MIGRTMERERTISNTVIGMYQSTDASSGNQFQAYFVFECAEPAVAVRSSLADARGSIQFDYDMDVSNSEKQDYETEKPPTPARRKSQSVDSNNAVSLHNIIHSKDKSDNDVPMMPHIPHSIAAVDECAVPAASPPVRKTSFATLPNNTTTWQQQSVNYQVSDSHSESLLVHY